MSLWRKHLDVVFRVNDDDGDASTSTTESATKVRNSLLLLHQHGHRTMSNASSKLLLEQKLLEYFQIMNDDSKSNSINNFAKPINSLLQGKVDTRHCANWKNNLSKSYSEALLDLKKSNHSNLETGCKSKEITQEDIDWLLDDKNDVMRPHFDKNHTLPRNERDSNVSTDKHKPLSENNKKNHSIATTGTMPNFPKNEACKSNSNFSNDPPKPSFARKRSNFNIPRVTDEEERKPSDKPELFRTARAELNIQNKKKYGNNSNAYRPIESNPIIKRSLGTTRSSVQSKFIPPIPKKEEEVIEEDPECEDERLKHIDPKMIELIRSEIIDTSAPVEWDDIAGLDFAKAAIQEAVVWPLLRPDIFTGLRRPPKGILLFGPPGTGKTLIGKCIASQCCATFFSISASSLTSKWIGDGEKMVRALFAVARCHQPAVVFIDEIDSLLIQRSDAEHEATRRIKTEFLVQLDGAATGDEDRLLVIGATNRPQELDEAARRRMVKRLYIPLPDLKARIHLITRLIRTERHSLTEEDIANVAELADGFSGADTRSLCSEAALGPIRSVPFSQITNISNEQVRPVSVDDFRNALKRVRPSVSPKDLENYIKWDLTYGSGNDFK